MVEVHATNGNAMVACRLIDEFVSTVEDRAASPGGQLITSEAAELLIDAAQTLKVDTGCTG